MYNGRNEHGQRTYKVGTYTVTASDEAKWQYACTCGTAQCQDADTGDQFNDCAHVGEVCDARAEFEAADAQMGDATP